MTGARAQRSLLFALMAACGSSASPGADLAASRPRSVLETRSTLDELDEGLSPAEDDVRPPATAAPVLVIGRPFDPDPPEPREPLAVLRVVLNAAPAHHGTESNVHVTAFAGNRPAVGAAVFLDAGPYYRPSHRFREERWPALQPVGMTDERGTLVVRTSAARFNVEVAMGEQRAYAAYPDLAYRSRSRPLRLLLSTQRAASGPLLRGAILVPPPSVPGSARVHVQDPSGNVAELERIPMDASGIGSFELPLPSLRGTYRVSAATPDASHDLEVWIDPEPEHAMALTHDLPRVMPDSGPLVALVRAPNVAAGAALTLSARLVQGRDERVLAERRVHGEGPHLLELPASRWPSRSGPPTAIVLSATDAAGRTGAVHHPLPFSGVPLRAELELDSYRHGPGEPVEATVTLFDVDDRPVAGEPFEIASPARLARATTDDQGRAQVRILLPALRTWWRHRGERVEVGPVPPPLPAQRSDWPRVDRWLVVRSRGRVLAARELVVDDRPIVARADRRVLRPGERVEIDVELRPDVAPLEDVVHVDVSDGSGAIVSSELVRWDGRRARVTSSAPEVGPMYVSLYGVVEMRGDQGLATEGIELTVARGPRGPLRIDAVESQPGTVRVRVSGLGEEPVAVRAHVRAGGLDVADPRSSPPPDWPDLVRTWGPVIPPSRRFNPENCWVQPEEPSGERPAQLGPGRFGWHPGEETPALVRLPPIPARGAPVVWVERTNAPDSAWLGIVHPDGGAAQLELAVPEGIAPSSVIAVAVMERDGHVRLGQAPLPTPAAVP